MALTDALSVACKALGFAADVYFEKDRTKYDTQDKKSVLTEKQVNRLFAIGNSKGISPEQIKKAIIKDYKKTKAEDLTNEEYDELCARLESAR
jgi:hypothetical protein